MKYLLQLLLFLWSIAWVSNGFSTPKAMMFIGGFARTVHDNFWLGYSQ